MGEKEMYRIMPAGDRGLVVEFGNVIDIQTNNRVQQLKKCLREAQIQGVLELQPTFRSLMIYYDPLKISYEELEKRNGIVADENEAMNILSIVGRRSWNNDDKNSLTVHSVVYNLTDKTVTWVGNENYSDPDAVYTFSLE